MTNRSQHDHHTGIDVGGTFTDVVSWDGSRLRTGKLPTTEDQSVAALEGFRRLGGGSLIHGTTVATNAVLQGAGAVTALVVDEGFEDLIEIGRQDRPSLYDLAVTRVLPPVSRDRRFGIPGRSAPGGGESGDRGSLDELAGRLRGEDAEAAAVSLLYSYVDPSYEQKVQEALRPLGIPVSVSSAVVAEFREFERASTTVLNASLMPVVSRYMETLAAGAAAAGARGEPAVMRSSGGLITAREAVQIPIAILLSGPAGGVVAAAALGGALGRHDLISFDMGGTSTDVCRVVGGRPEVSYERPVGGIPVRMPSVAIHTVGAGGGSIGWVDEGGALRVGPRSAGASPGPACYGWGGSDATVTDANVALHRIDPRGSLGASVEIDHRAAVEALGRLGLPLGMAPEKVARGMIEVVEEHMARALRRVSVEEGADPRGSVLVAFGGAGGLHATALARRLEMAGVVIPPHAGVFSALGLLLAAPRADTARTVMLDGDRLSEVDDVVAIVEDEAAQRVASMGAGVEAAATFVDVRYLGQSHETSVRYFRGDGATALEQQFHEAHRARNGFAREGDPIEVVTVRAEARGAPALEWGDLPTPEREGEASRGTRKVHAVDGPLDAEVWWRPGLAPGDHVVGPAVIEELEATTYLGPGERAVVHDSGALEVEW